MELRIHRFLEQTEVEGPGRRACIWVQGCSIHCLGCAVPWTWSPRGGQSIPVSELADRILDGPPIEGVTFVGGEPFDQAQALAALGRRVQDAGLSVVTFTGYLIEDIVRESRSGWQELLAVTDLLLDGPFRRDLADLSRPWVGSSNQRFHFLTSRYQHLEAQIHNMSNRIEVRLHPDGTILVNGMVSAADLNELFDGFAKR